MTEPKLWTSFHSEDKWEYQIFFNPLRVFRINEKTCKICLKCIINFHTSNELTVIMKIMKTV